MSSVMRRLALVGLVQGIVLLGLHQASQDGMWLRTQAPLLLGLLYATVALPLAWYLTEGIDGLSPRRRRVTVLLVGVVIAVLGACEGLVGADPSGEARFGMSMIAGLALGFVGIPLLVHAERGGRLGWRWHYAALFRTAWRNAMMMIVAGILTGILWGVLIAGAGLMRSIGLDIVWDAISSSWFYLPATAAVFASATALAVVRADTLVALRRFWLSMNQAFLPLVLLFSVKWTVALPFTGLDVLFRTKMAGFALLWFAALAINFMNAAYQDGQSPPPFTHWLRRTVSLAWWTMLVVVAVVGIALFLRIGQYGWSADRVWGIFVLVMAAGYTLGYSLSGLLPARGWMWSVGQTNVVMALVMCAGLIALSSPIADARRIAVNSQVERLLNGKTPPEKFDLRYLDQSSGVYGRNALQVLADGKSGHPQAAQFAALVQTYRKAMAERSRPYADLSDDTLRQQWKLEPAGTPAQPELIDALLARLRSQRPSSDETKCLESINSCFLWMGDVNGDATPELLLVVDRGWVRNVLVYRWEPAAKQLTRIGKIERVSKEWVAALRQGKAQMVPSPLRDIEAGGSRVRILSE